MHKQNGQQFAVKIVDVAKFTSRPQLTLTDLKREATICLQLNHPHVVKLVDTFVEDGTYYVLYELMEGADLFLEIVKRAMAGFVYSEAVASHYMRQILEALKHCHTKGVIHRNIQPHCMLLANKENSSPIKLGGFGMAIEIEELENSPSGCLVMPQFSAPEMLQKFPYGKPVDIWATGAVLYVLLTGQLPFFGTKEQQLVNSAVNSLNAMKCKQWKDISDDAKDLVQRMLELNPSHRITAEEALRHPWIKVAGGFQTIGYCSQRRVFVFYCIAFKTISITSFGSIKPPFHCGCCRLQFVHFICVQPKHENHEL
jgi:calcium/calmodulin-dependent serine protein kinase